MSVCKDDFIDLQCLIYAKIDNLEFCVGHCLCDFKCVISCLIIDRLYLVEK